MPAGFRLQRDVLLRRDVFKAAGAWTTLTLLAAPHQTARSVSADHAFIDKLVARMTLQEKAGQLSLYGDATRPDGAAANPVALAQSKTQLLDEIARGRIGGLFNGIGVAGARELQRQAVERSRLKIPLIFAGDVIHGVRTIFPVPLAEASAFDTDLAERTARAAAVEATALGLHWTFAPMVDIARDQRWGRVVEGAGEDVYLGRMLAAARVRGFQGRSLRDDDSLLATVKHFAAYGAVTGGLDYNSVDIAETTLRDVHLPPFKAGIDAGALAVMTSFNDINGTPSTANRPLLTGVLRDEWRFRGLVVSDYRSDAELITHGVAADDKDAAKKALLAGCDMSMQSGLYNEHLPQLLREGSVPMAVLNRAVKRVLMVKRALGLFDNPYRSLDLQHERSRIRTPETLALAREAARRSVVLLKNEAAILPLKPAGQRIALIGPFGADRDHLMGAWALWADMSSGVSLEAGLRAAMADPALLSVVKGCEIDEPIEGGAAAAVAAARAADVVVLALGEGQDMSGESQSRVDIGLPAAQVALAEAVAGTNKPVVLVLRHGRALALADVLRKSQAIMAAWFLGSETGHALADLIFGQHSPSGRLPVSFPQASGQQPYYYNHKSTGRPSADMGDRTFTARYREVSQRPLYPFGHGLTYSDVSYGATRLDAAVLPWSGTLRVSATLRNTGARAVREVAQLYVRQRLASLTRPVRELKGFKPVDIEPGESVTVSFSLSRHDLAFVQADMKTAAQPGVFEVAITASSEGAMTAQFELRPAR
jgi:beta-glucosidase